MSSSLAKYRQAKAALAAAQAEIEQLQADPGLKRQLEFETKLRALMGEYSQSLVDINMLLDANYKPPKAKPISAPAAAKKSQRVPNRTYKNPHTGEEIHHTSGPNKKLQKWKQEFGESVVKSWAVINNA